MLPLSAPALVTLIVVNALWVWNELLIALVFLPDEGKRTLMVGVTVFQSRYNLDVPLTMAGMCLASIPMFLLYLFGQRLAAARSGETSAMAGYTKLNPEIGRRRPGAEVRHVA